MSIFGDGVKKNTKKIQRKKIIASRGVRVPELNSGTRCSGRVGFWSPPEIIGYPAATSDTRINRIPVAASDIRINRVCDATWAFDVVEYLLQLSVSS